MIENKEEFAITGAETSISGFELIGTRMINQLTEFQARTSEKFRFYLYQIIVVLKKTSNLFSKKCVTFKVGKKPVLTKKPTNPGF